MPNFNIAKWRISWPFWVLVAFLLLVFLMGGASRPDVQSLILLRPIAILLCGTALLSLNKGYLRDYRGAFLFFGAAFGLVLIHLIPLPPVIWQSLPGHAIVAEIDRSAGLGDVWRPLTLVPAAGWNSFYSLFVPLAVFLLFIQIRVEERYLLLPVLIALGLLSGFLGILQAAGDPNGSLYLYRVTNNGLTVGLFANRNHQAVLLVTLFPMLAVYASYRSQWFNNAKMRGLLALALYIALVPLILITGSRAGVLIGIIGIGLGALLYRRPAEVTASKAKRRPKGKASHRGRSNARRFNISTLSGSTIKNPIVIAGGSVFLIAALTIVMSRAYSIDRFFSQAGEEDMRTGTWGPIVELVWKYFPTGSGAGSFVEAYQIDEKTTNLSTVYLNHAHNDWLEIALTFGLPGVIFLFVSVGIYLSYVVKAFRHGRSRRRQVLFMQLGASILFILGLASVFDYPLRTPIMMALGVIAAMWLCNGGKRVEEIAGS